MIKFSQIRENHDCLYRYRAYDEGSLSALRQGRLYFSAPKNFNDPYDNLIFADANMIASEITSSIRNGMDGYLESKKELDSFEFKLMEFLWSKPEKVEEIIKERADMIYSALDTIKLNLKQYSRVICFSENYDSMLMWSHYADYHRGFLLVYDKKDIEEAKRYDDNDSEIQEKTRLRPVNYVDSQTDLTKELREYVRYNMFANMGNMGDIEVKDASLSPIALKRVITEKSIEWAYEKEWRLIPNIPRVEKKSSLNYIECKPLAVIIGNQCQNTKRDQLIDICKKIKVPAYGIYLSASNPKFKLEIDDDGGLELAKREYFFTYSE